MEPKICMEMLRNLSEKLGKISCHSHDYSMAKIARLDDAFPVLEQEVSPVEGQSLLPQKDKKRSKMERQKET